LNVCSITANKSSFQSVRRVEQSGPMIIRVSAASSRARKDIREARRDTLIQGNRCPAYRHAMMAVHRADGLAGMIMRRSRRDVHGGHGGRSTSATSVRSVTGDSLPWPRAGTKKRERHISATASRAMDPRRRRHHQGVHRVRRRCGWSGIRRRRRTAWDRTGGRRNARSVWRSTKWDKRWCGWSVSASSIRGV
jgi:hypothetical protein